MDNKSIDRLSPSLPPQVDFADAKSAPSSDAKQPAFSGISGVIGFSSHHIDPAEREATQNEHQAVAAAVQDELLPLQAEAKAVESSAISHQGTKMTFDDQQREARAAASARWHATQAAEAGMTSDSQELKTESGKQERTGTIPAANISSSRSGDLQPGASSTLQSRISEVETQAAELSDRLEQDPSSVTPQEVSALAANVQDINEAVRGELVELGSSTHVNQDALVQDLELLKSFGERVEDHRATLGDSSVFHQQLREAIGDIGTTLRENRRVAKMLDPLVAERKENASRARSRVAVASSAAERHSDSSHESSSGESRVTNLSDNLPSDSDSSRVSISAIDDIEISDISLTADDFKRHNEQNEGKKK